MENKAFNLNRGWISRWRKLGKFWILGEEKLSGNRDTDTGGGIYNESIGRNFIQAKNVSFFEGGKDGVSKNDTKSDIDDHITLVVARFGKADYRSISEAIKNAEEGTSILVRPGIYEEGIVINKPLEIIGEGTKDKIIIQSSDSDCILMQTDYAVVKNLTLWGRAGRKGKNFFGVDIPQGHLILENCDITSDSLSCVAIHGSSTNPTIKNCHIHDGKDCGVWVYENGEGTIEYCEIFANAKSGVDIKQGANPMIKNCHIHDGKACGVSVWKNGEGTIEDCYIFANTHAGVTIEQEGNPLMKNCKINRNGYEAIWVFNNGKGTVENCDLTNNKRGAWDIDETSQVQRSNNITN